jgi:hypothetical protein
MNHSKFNIPGQISIFAGSMKVILRIVLIFFAAIGLNRVSAIYAPGSSQSGSVLSSGQWFKIGLTGNGIYRIEYSKLVQLGLTNPSNPRIFGNNFGQLSYFNDDPKPDDLKEIAILLVKGSDGVFNEGDYLLFYGQGTHRWKYDQLTDKYEYIRHNYSDTAFYFLTSSGSPGRSITQAPSVSSPATYYSESHDALFIHEEETENLIKSGREWFQPVSVIKGISINPGFSDVITSDDINYTIRVLGRSSIPSTFRFYEGTVLIRSIQVPEVNLLSSTGTYAAETVVNGTLTPESGSPSFEIKYIDNGEQGSEGWLDYVKLQARVTTSFSGKTFEFSDSKTVTPGSITEFTVHSSVTGYSIWDVTDPFNPQIIQYTVNGEYGRFRINTDSLRTFLIFSPGTALSPAFPSGPVPAQDLHNSEPADMIIVVHPLFLPYAEKLADIHHSDNGLTSLIVTPVQIYNEFSGGIPDIVAIRNFLRMKYLNQMGTGHPLKYLLLFGDGSIENKTLPPLNPNYIPTYQSQNSTVVVSSFTSDDFFGLLEDGEGEANGTVDLGIGRFPVSDTNQASIMVSKVRKYLSAESTGAWKNIITISADDEDGNTHMLDAEGLYSLLNANYPDFNIDKIYLDAYRQITSVNGQSYPDVTKAINDRINSGCLIFDYLGHGNEIGLAHERVVKTEDINSWKNGAKEPLFITATCEFSRFDDVEINPVTREMTGKNSAGEMVILNPNGGGIALMTTTRVVYSAPNYTLNSNILYYAFSRDSSGNALRLGDIIRIAKVNSGSGMNKRNFLLLGDPAVRLAYPWHGKVITDSINNVPVTQPVDTLKALSVVTIAGHLEDNNGNMLNDFNGIVYPVVFDKIRKIRTLANDGGQTMEFNLRNNILFSGKTVAAGGKFSFSFLVPKDIDYSLGAGKISYYANRDEEDYGGSFNGFIVGGFNNTTITDTTGPRITLYLNDTLFRDGGICDNNPTLLAIIEDDGGINTTGSGIGHDLTAFFDSDRNRSFELNSYFENDLDNYMKGRITYPVNNLTNGQHSVSLKAWDNYNNSSEAILHFLVKTEKGFIISNLINYPNPFIDNTSITAEINKAGDDLAVRIYIYNMAGQVIRIIKTTLPSTGYRLTPIIWDGLDEGGKKVGRGIYPYSYIITDTHGEKVKASGRMIIL